MAWFLSKKVVAARRVRRRFADPTEVRSWPEADVVWAQKGVRFQEESGHDAD